MLLADLGARVIRIERTEPADLGVDVPLQFDLLNRSKESIAINLKSGEGSSLALELCRTADILIEGFRPGVMERLGLGPVQCLEANPRLIYGRITGWGQDGPFASRAGHDLNYIAITGVLDAIGRENARPSPPLNLVGDNGGGALYLAFGILAAYCHAQKTGVGQVVDAAMVDGAASLATMFYAFQQMGEWNAKRGTNIIDSGAYFYDVYETSDAKLISIAAIERRFHDEMLRKIGIEDPAAWDPSDRDNWKVRKAELESRFRQRTQAEWIEQLGNTDTCFAPVMSLSEAWTHPQNKARSTFVNCWGVVQPAPAPRFSRTSSGLPTHPPIWGGDTVRILREHGLSETKIADLLTSGVIAGASET
jgi:alpha-methylacyl-CoA racemase